jgi:hypothetical protein
VDVLIVVQKMKKPIRSRIFMVLVCIGILGLFVAGGVVEPRTSVGHVVFHAAYAFPPTRPAVLRFYTWSLVEFEGGYLPPSMDEYLIDRLAYCQGKPEQSAIIDFQIRQGSGRWGDSAARSHETYQKEMIANIMSRLDGMSEEDAVSAMVFIDSLRRQYSLGKGGFINMRTYSDTLNRPEFVLAKESFRKWWGDGSGWPRIRPNDPLAGTELAIGSGPS